MRLPIVRALLASWVILHSFTAVLAADEPPKQGTYMVLPVKGIIGHHCTDEVIARCLKTAESNNVRTIVLEIDSPGGLSSELEKITQRLVDWQKVDGQRAIAYVSPRAHSAAAIIAIACKDIVMAPSSTIGATAEVGGQLSGLIKLKRESVTRAGDRALAQFAGHDPALVEAMADPSGELWMRKDPSGKPAFNLIHRPRGPIKGKGPVQAPPRTSRIKARNELLTLTADDAVSYGLARGVVKDVAAIGSTLDIKTWVEEDAKLRTITQSLFDQADATEKEISRLADLIERAMNAAAATTLPAMTRQLTELRNAKTMTAKLTQIAEKTAYFNSMLDLSSVQKAAQVLDARIKAMEARIEAEKERK